MTKDNQEIIKAIKQENQKLEKDFELHTKALAEDFEKKVEIVGEGWKGVQEKVDIDEFQALEKRVILLERKLKSA